MKIKKEIPLQQKGVHHSCRNVVNNNEIARLIDWGCESLIVAVVGDLSNQVVQLVKMHHHGEGGLKRTFL